LTDMVRKLARCWSAILRKSRLPISCENLWKDRSWINW